VGAQRIESDRNQGKNNKPFRDERLAGGDYDLISTGSS
jgi:hypothetical protein